MFTDIYTYVNGNICLNQVSLNIGVRFLNLHWANPGEQHSIRNKMLS